MKEQLTKQELSAYLPYKVMCLNQHLPDVEFVKEELIGISNHITWSGVFNARHGSNHVPVSAIKPILLPLSSLTQEIEHKGEKFVPLTRLNEMFSYEDMKLVYYINSGLGWEISSSFSNTALSFEEMHLPFQKLAEWHIDFQNLIPRGLAVNKLEL